MVTIVPNGWPSQPMMSVCQSSSTVMVFRFAGLSPRVSGLGANRAARARIVRTRMDCIVLPSGRVVQTRIRGQERVRSRRLHRLSQVPGENLPVRFPGGQERLPVGQEDERTYRAADLRLAFLH